MTGALRVDEMPDEIGRQCANSFDSHDQFVRKKQNSLSNPSGTTDQYNRGSRSTDRLPWFRNVKESTRCAGIGSGY